MTTWRLVSPAAMDSHMQVDTSIQQIKDLLTSGSVHRVLVTTGMNVDPDALGSALAMAEALENMGMETVVAVEDFEQGRYRFLPGIERVLSSVGQKSLVVSIEVGENPIEKINYNAEATTFNLILTPRSGQVNVDQIRYSYAGLTFDAVVVVDTAKKALLGKWVQDFGSELGEVPMINIDHHADNERFGTLNLIQPDLPSAASVIYQLLQEMGQTISPNMATNLLAGLLSDTGGFANSNANADSLRLAADLVDADANLRDVMVGLFRDLSVAALQLWSRVLASVELVEPGIVVAQVTRDDVIQTGATKIDEDSLDMVTNGFVPAVTAGKVAVVLKEKEHGEVRGSLRSIDPAVNVQPMAKQLGGGGHTKASGFKLADTDLASARAKVISVVAQGLQSQPESEATPTLVEQPSESGQITPEVAPAANQVSDTQTTTQEEDLPAA